MPIFSQLENEDEVQLKDRTRLDGSKSYNTANQPAFSKMYLKPCENEPVFSIYNASPTLRFLDWEYRNWEIDIDSSNNKLNFSESGVELTATLTSGTYSLSGLATQIQTQLDAAGALTYTVSVSADDKITILATGAFGLLIKTGANRYVSILNQLFFGEADLLGKDRYTSDRIEYLTRKATIYVGENKQQVDSVTCVADVAGSLNSKYFLLYSGGDATKYYVWYDVASGGTDPLISGATGIEVDISAGDSASAVATATAAAIDALGAFISSALSAVVTITHASSDWNTPPTNGNLSGFTFSTTTQGEKQDSESNYIKVYSVLGDNLFCSDAELMQYEPDIRKWVAPGRNSFLNIHRQAQKYILEKLDQHGWKNLLGRKFKKKDILDIAEFKAWARSKALSLIYGGIKNAAGDVWSEKKNQYEGEERQARNKAMTRIDIDESGDLYLTEGIDTSTIFMARR